ncbi:MAG TPA: hypothetical protein VFV78_03445, partial [Vicinamibacterales bacterium]|nr:hypothetical protein [Vicinamibacterales bacterium]
GGVPGAPPIPNVEGDGVSYSGIVWFVVILTITTLVCQLLMVVMFKAMDHQKRASDAAAPPPPLAQTVNPSERSAPQGRVYPEMVAIGSTNGPAPALLVREPLNLDALHAREHEELTTYGYADKNAGTYRIPIERAKELVLEQKLLPVRGAAPATAAPEKGKGKNK